MPLFPPEDPAALVAAGSDTAGAVVVGVDSDLASSKGVASRVVMAAVEVDVDVLLEEVAEGFGGACWIMVDVTMNLYCGEVFSSVVEVLRREWRIVFWYRKCQWNVKLEI